VEHKAEHFDHIFEGEFSGKLFEKGVGCAGVSCHIAIEVAQCCRIAEALFGKALRFVVDVAPSADLSAKLVIELFFGGLEIFAQLFVVAGGID